MASSKRPSRPSRPPPKKSGEVRKDEEITLVDVLGSVKGGPGPSAPPRKDGSGEHGLLLPDLIMTDEEDIERSSVTGWPEDVHHAFQRLWTKAVGQDGYDAKEWRSFRALLDRWLLPPGA
jgi:hypothetical protein